VTRHVVSWSAHAREDLVRLHEFLLDRATEIADLDLADKAIEAIERTVQHGLSQSPMIYRKAGRHPTRREVIIPFGATGYVALYEILPTTEVLVLSVRHQREEDYL
jgi:plasmid stabilization system protein ParE